MERYHNMTTASLHVDAQENLLPTYIKTVACLLIVCYLVYDWKQRRTLKGTKANIDSIPGPWNLPVIGSLLHIGFNPHLSFMDFRQKYGDIFKVRIGCQEMVVICGLKLIQSAMCENSKAFCGRPKLFTFKYLSEGKSLSFNSYDKTVKLHKQMAEWGLNNFLTAADFVNNVVYSEACNLVKKLKSNKDPVDPIEDIMWAVGHVKYKICYGDGYLEVEDFETVIKGTINLLACHNSGSILNFFPWTRKLMWWRCREIKHICESICTIVKRKTKECSDTFNRDDKMSNVTDALLLAYQRNKNDIVERDRLLHTGQDFIGAGLDIVYTSLHWAVLYLAQYSNIQDRIKTEIFSVIGRSKCRAPRKEDASNMPYTQAFICEVIRHSCVVPFALPHTNMEDTSLAGYFLPKDTFLMINLYSVHKDPSIWENPDEFEPGHFLDENGRFKSGLMDKQFIPFGIGKRKCIGDTFAKQELFMFISTMLQTTIIRKPCDVDSYDLNPDFGLVLRPKPFKVLFLDEEDGISI